MHKGTLIQVFPALANLTDATSFNLRDDWSGFINYVTKYANYNLKRNGNQFEGDADFHISVSQEATRHIVIPLNVAQAFLQTLEQIPLEEGPYTPKINQADTYLIDIAIQILTNAGPLDIFTNSQNDRNATGNAPWGVNFMGRTFVVNSDIPAKALDTLRPYLHEEVIEELIKAFDNALTPTAAFTSLSPNTPKTSTPNATNMPNK